MRVSTQKEKVNHRSRVQSILAPLIQLLNNLNNTMGNNLSDFPWVDVGHGVLVVFT